MQNKKRLFGLIGYPLGHSFSQSYFTEKFYEEDIKDTSYKLFPLQTIKEFPDLLKEQTHLKGVNVTIPYKEQVIPYLDELAEAAAKIGAVNTIRITEKGTKGFNTDVYGFEQSLKPLLQKQHQKALILGTGGAAKAVRYVLERLEINYKMVSRQPKNEDQLAYEELNQAIMQEYQLMINTTPLGMHPNTLTFPDIPYAYATPEHLFYDLVYNPTETTFLIKAKLQGATIKNGLEMLYLQAEKAWEIWNE